jgi:prepilin-type N-terminal cleavage/methylation domain-containing protein
MKNLSHPLRNRRRSAFTLIEIMVATVIMVVLVGLVVQITSEVLKVWNRSAGKLSANAEARIAMDMITQDLETAVFRNNGQQWLEAVESSFTNPLGANGYMTTQLKLFTPALDRDTGDAGDICAVAYLLDYSSPIDGGNGGDQTFILYRNLVDPETTFDEMMGSGNQETFTHTEWSDSSIKDDGKNYLVSNIVDFRIDFYVEGKDSDASGLSLLVPSPVKFGGTNATVGSDATGTYARNLSYAVVTLQVISDQALEIIQNGKVDQTGLSLKEYVAANSDVFVRRVNFMARPL